MTSVPRARLRSATERMPSTALATTAAAPVRWVRVSPSKASTSSPTLLEDDVRTEVGDVVQLGHSASTFSEATALSE